MPDFNWPSAHWPVAFSLRVNPDVRRASSGYGGNTRITDKLDDSWQASMTLDTRSNPVAVARVEATVSKLNLGYVAVFGHIARQALQGTMAGSPTLSVSALKGAENIVVQTTAGATVKAGDMLGVSGLLLQVSADATANGSGVLTVPLVNRLRKALTSGAAIVYAYPTTRWLLTSEAGVSLSNDGSETVTLNFEELISG